MSKTDDALSQIFDTEPIETKETLPVEVESGEVITVSDDTIDGDFNKVRINISNLIEKGNTAIDNLLKVAKESEHPRAYEVAANLLKTLSDLNKDLLEIQKKKMELLPTEKPQSGKGPLIDKAVFVGSTEELISLIKGKK